MKNEEINALVLGAGAFGKHYVRILSRLNEAPLSSLPKINQIVITRTSREAAEKTAETMRSGFLKTGVEIVGEKADNVREVKDILDRYMPGFIGITARDDRIGDAIHPIYTRIAMRHGNVLCEKPFCTASGDGSSLRKFHETFENNHGVFGLELPMAAVKKELYGIPEVSEMFLGAKTIRFHWEAVSSETNIIDNLVLHPWSLLPADWLPISADTRYRGAETKVVIAFLKHCSDEICECEITLRPDGNFRGVEIDGYGIGFFNVGKVVRCIELDRSLFRSALDPFHASQGNLIAAVKNPLKQNILAILQGNPIIGIVRAYASQAILEMLHGYQVEQRVSPAFERMKAASCN